MGRRGPKPESTAFRLIKGNPGHRPINTTPPEPPTGSDEEWKCPSKLKGAARREWQRQVLGLRTSGTLTLVDRTIFEVYCQAIGDLDEAERSLRAAKRLKKMPQIELGYRNLVVKLRAQIRQLAAEIGATPVSRASVKRADPSVGAQDPFESFGGGK